MTVVPRSLCEDLAIGHARWRRMIVAIAAMDGRSRQEQGETIRRVWGPGLDAPGKVTIASALMDLKAAGVVAKFERRPDGHFSVELTS